MTIWFLGVLGVVAYVAIGTVFARVMMRLEMWEPETAIYAVIGWPIYCVVIAAAVVVVAGMDVVGDFFGDVSHWPEAPDERRRRREDERTW